MKKTATPGQASDAWSSALRRFDRDLQRRGAAERTRRAYGADVGELATWAAERVARNTPIQGTAADIIKRAMVSIGRELGSRGMQSKMLLSVHDELIFEAPPDEKPALESLVVEHMQAAAKLDVPLLVDRGWGASWGDAK